MYIKKPVLILSIISLIVITSILTVGTVNPFGFTEWEEFFRFSAITRLIENEYYEDIPVKDYVNTALEGVAIATGDPYTRFIWGEDAKEYVESIEGNFCGVGIYLEYNPVDNTIDVVSSIPGTPAEEAGIVPGDKVIAVNGKTFTGEQLNEAVQFIRGESFTEVTVSFLRKATNEIEDITMERREIVIPAVESKMVTDTVGLIRLVQFTETAQKQFYIAYQECLEQGMEKLVIDLRNNPGGLMEEAAMVANMFIDDGEIIVYTMDKAKERVDYTASGDAMEIPIVVLTNGYSASASEILTGALKDHGVAYHIGEKTYGKGIVQGVFQVGEEEILSVTESRYFTPNGVCIHDTGISPDEEILMNEELYHNLDTLSLDEDAQLKRAIAWFEE